MEANYFERHPRLKDALGLAIFALCVLVGTLFINAFVFRSFSVVGISMEDTLQGGDRLIVNRMPVTIDQLQNKPYLPKRGQIIVFKNPQWTGNGPDEYIVKRVIAFPDERVTVKNGVLKVYNDANPKGFEPDTTDTNGRPKTPTSGDVDQIVREGTLFVAGDNRVGENSFDSRSGLGLVPLIDVVGPVSFRIFPLTKIGSL